MTIEDAHLADSSSRDFLRFLAQSLRSERLLVVVTVRSDDLHREHPVRALMAELQRHDRVMRIELEPLSADAVAEQVEAILGATPSAELLAGLFARAQGNPLYTEELLAAGDVSDRGLPETLRDALLLRADALDEPTREVLRLLSAVGRPVDDALIEPATELGRRELGAALRQGVDHNVLTCDRRTGHYGVRHALFAEAVYDDLLPVERASLHHRIATALERSPSDENAAQRAHHWERGDEPRQALAASVQAGLAAERVFGYGEALSPFQRAVRLWEQAPPDPDGSPLDLVQLLARAAQAARSMGESDRACELCRRALDTSITSASRCGPPRLRAAGSLPAVEHRGVAGCLRARRPPDLRSRPRPADATARRRGALDVVSRALATGAREGHRGDRPGRGRGHARHRRLGARAARDRDVPR